MPGTPTPACPSRVGTDPARERARFGPVFAAEWGKLVVLRTTLLVPFAGTAILVLGAWYFSRHVRIAPGAHDAFAADFDPLAKAFGAEAWAVLNSGLAVVGALSLAGEYAAGSVRPLFAAVPDRTRVVLAKAAALGVVGVGAGLAASVSALVVSQRELSVNRLDMALTDPVAVRAAAVSAVFPAVAALIGLAAGALLRHEAAAALGAFAVVTMLPSLFQSDALALPAAAGRVLPVGAWLALANAPAGHPANGGLLPWAALVAWPVAAVGCAVWAVRRRDV